jgi:hypothetical protein
METCAECGKPIQMNEPSYYKRDPAGGDFGKTYHSNCGDPFGHKAAVAKAVSDERERCAKIAEGWLATYGKHKPEYVSAQTWAVDAVEDIAEEIRKGTAVTS